MPNRFKCPNCGTRMEYGGACPGCNHRDRSGCGCDHCSEPYRDADPLDWDEDEDDDA